MPKVSNANMQNAHSAITAFLDYMGIQFSTDYTCDASGNTTGLYAYGIVTEDSFARTIFGKAYWYVVSAESQEFCYCDSITFYDDYDQYGNFRGRKVSIVGGVSVFSFSLPRDIIYSYNAGDIGFYYDRLIMNDSGCPLWLNFGSFLFGNGGYDGSANLITQKIKWYRWGTRIDEIDAYWGSLNNYEVVQIGNSYYFKIPNRNILMPGNGTEGTVKSLNIIIVQEEEGSIAYVTSSEIELDNVTGMIQMTASEIELDTGFIYAEMLKQIKVKLEIM
jgi:hypothetical protein